MGHLIAFVGPKGGTGVTSLALACAQTMRKAHGANVVLVEAGLMFGDLATAVGLRPTRSLIDILDKPRPWTPNLIGRAVLRHPILDLDLVLAPGEAHLAEKITPKDFSEFIQALMISHDFVLVDVGHQVAERELDLFDKATAIYLVVAPSPAGVNTARKLVRLFGLLRGPVKRLGVLLNDAPGSPGCLSVDQVQAGLGVPVIHLVPRGADGELEFQSLRELDPTNPRGNALKSMVTFGKDLWSRLWTKKGAPGVNDQLKVQDVGFDAFVAVAGRDISGPPQPPVPGGRASYGEGVRLVPPPMAPGAGRNTLGDGVRLAPVPPPLAPPPPVLPIASPLPIAPLPLAPLAPPQAPGRITGGDRLTESPRPGSLAERLAQVRNTQGTGGTGARGSNPLAQSVARVARAPGKIAVIVADDNESFRRGLCRALAFEDRIQVLGEAVDGQDLLMQVMGNPPDMVLADAHMPKIDGLEATRQIGLSFPNVKVVIMSVQGEQDVVRRAMEAGARKFLLKPFPPDEVSRTVDLLFPR